MEKKLKLNVICDVDFVKLENSAIEYWPVLIKPNDILLLLVVLFITGFVSAYLPGKILVNKLLKS
jgi:hypothetical protein